MFTVTYDPPGSTVLVGSFQSYTEAIMAAMNHAGHNYPDDLTSDELEAYYRQRAQDSGSTATLPFANYNIDPA